MDVKMICPICGKEYGTKNKFCISCGNELVSKKDMPAKIADEDVEDSNTLNVTETANTPPDKNPSIITPPIIETPKKENPVEETPNNEPPVLINDIDTSASVREFEQRSNITLTTNEGIIEDTPNDETVNNITLDDEIDIDANIDTDLPKTVPIAIKTKEPFFTRLGIGTVSFFTAILMLSFIIIATGSYIGRLLTDEKNIEQFINQADLLALPVNSFNSNTVENDDTLLDAIYTMSQGSGVTKETIKEVYHSSNIKEFLANNLSDYALYIRTGDNPYKLSAETIKQIYTQNLPLLNSLIDTELSEHDIEMVYNEIDKFEPVLNEISSDGISSSFIAPLRIFISTPVFIIEICLSLFMIILIFVINKKASRSLKWCGVPIFLWGITLLVTTFLIRMRIILTNVDSGFAANTIYDIVKIISGNVYLVGAGMSVVGIGLVVISTLTSKKAIRQI